MSYPSQPPPYGMNLPSAQVIMTNFGPNPTIAVCPSCNKSVSSRVDHEATTKTHLFALLLCLIFCPCGILPYCMDSCQATNHYCPNCGAYLGTYDH